MFSYSENGYGGTVTVTVTTPAGLEFDVAEATDLYWADTIVSALNLQAEMERM